MEITVPWPSRDLHPNSRGHWSKRSRAAKAARQAAMVLARQAGLVPGQLPAGRVQVWITGFPADKRRRDADGLLSALKPTLDGLADALGLDDRLFVPHPFISEITHKGGDVRIRLNGDMPDEHK